MKCVVFKKMKNPVIRELGVYYVSDRRILEIELEYIQHYRKMYIDKVINEYGKLDNEIEDFEFQAVEFKDDSDLPKLYKESDRLKLIWNDNGVKKEKKLYTKRSYENAYQTMVKFINENLDGKYVFAGDKW